MMEQNIKSGGKGFMHAIEGIIAAIIILSYTASVVQYPQDNNDWSSVKQEQVAREFLSSFQSAGLSHSVVEGRSGVFLGVSKYFLGAGKSYGAYIDGLLPKSIIIGVVSNQSETLGTSLIGCPAGVYSEYNCYSGSFRSHDFVLVDNDTGLGNSVEDYDAIYFDSDGDTIYDEYEGPKYVSSSFNVSGEIWVFYSVDNDTMDVEFINGEDFVQYRKNLAPVVLNGRQTNISVRAITNYSDFNNVDVLVIPRYMNLEGIEGRIWNYLDKGKSIIEVADITADRIDAVQSGVFGLMSVDYDVAVSPSAGVKFEYFNVSDISAKVNKYFDYINMVVDTDRRIVYLNTSWYPATYEFDCYLENMDYYFGHVDCVDADCLAPVISGPIIEYVDTSGPSPVCRIGNPNSRTIYYWGNFSFRDKDYFALSINYTGIEYDRIVVDLNRDMDLTNDGGFLEVGDVIEFDSMDYLIMNIYRDGRGFEIRPIDDHEFVSSGYEKLYSINNDTEYIIVDGYDEYYITSMNEGDMSVIVTSTDGVGTCTAGYIPGNEYRFNNTWGLPYNVVIVNISAGFNALMIDLDSDNNCNEYGEGPFYSGDLVRVGPEYYRIDIDLAGTYLNWTLEDRWNVPYVIANDRGGLRRSVWINSNMDSVDEWNLIRSVIVWSANKKSDFILSADATNTVMVKGTFVDYTDMFQPYGIYFRMGA